MKRMILRLTLVLAAVLTLARPARAQTILSETTLNAAVTSTAATTTFTVVSTTTAPTANWAVGNILWVDLEATIITAIPSSTTVTVRRGQLGTLIPPNGHASAAVVYVGSPNSFISADPLTNGAAGRCTRSNYTNMPLVNTRNGNVWSCPQGTGRVWAATNVQPITYGSVSTSPF